MRGSASFKMKDGEEGALEDGVWVGEGVTVGRAAGCAELPPVRGQPDTGVLPAPPAQHPAHVLRPSVPTEGRNTATWGHPGQRPTLSNPP